MAGKMASILALSLLLAMQIGDVQATHCPPSGCPADVTDDVEFIQKRVNVEPPLEKRVNVEPALEKVKAGEGGETTDGSINGEGFVKDEGSEGSDGGHTCSWNEAPLTLTVQTKSVGDKNSWSIDGCYEWDAAKGHPVPCAGGLQPKYGSHRESPPYGSHQTYKASCCCPGVDPSMDGGGRTDVELSCRSSDHWGGWHGGFIHVKENGMNYCAGFSDGYSKYERIPLTTAPTPGM